MELFSPEQDEFGVRTSSQTPNLISDMKELYEGQNIRLSTTAYALSNPFLLEVFVRSHDGRREVTRCIAAEAHGARNSWGCL
jgi:hypothetical protein